MAAKGLKTLIRLAKWEVDEKRRILVALQGREDEILAAIRHAEESLVHEQQVAAEDAAGVGFAYAAFANAWLARREQLMQMLEQVRQEIVRARDILAEAFNQLKTYEITQKERERRAQAELDKKEQAFLDEVGLNIHRRRDTGEE
ncbi:Putative flagelar FliJ protein [Magnetospirillum sp. XM-1]|uniref:flagellar export protein FliJ n=1 Tax=Magnetospirillum sp. XM-1 TaxID=1663591 RepID=UPI00073DE19A|nr:flagellar export protein FliJ [Magnetospirillum sp. XM-1]CUW41828.1 Putative flagelar FliJ protein [Magnetospirillum sp. XM-1]